MKLKKVTVTFDYIIVVEDTATEYNQYDIARNNSQEAFKDVDLYQFDVDIEDYEEGSVDGWADDCIPYGGDGNTPTGEYK